MTGALLVRPAQGRGDLMSRLALALGAVALVGGAVAVLIWWLAPAQPLPPARNPFGVGVREAAPSVSGLGGYVLALQAQFYVRLQAALTGFRTHGDGLWPLVALGLAYGVFHAAGPGHGKAVIGSYLVSSERALAKGLLLSLAAALVQAFVAIALVLVIAGLLRGTAATMTRTASTIELASFALVAALGVALLWRKAGKLLVLSRLTADPSAARPDTCDHAHLPPPAEIERLTGWRDMTGVVLAAGIRPCSGAIIVLVFAFAQGILLAGIAATFAMALGTALTTGLFAALAVYAKGLALRLAGGRGAGGALAVAGLELLAAAFLLVVGLSLMLGVWETIGAA